MLESLIRGLARNRGGIVLLSGLAAVLSGVERMMSPSRAPAATSRPQLTGGDRFRIYRTQSELGYAYWVLQGFGQFSCFALFDTWSQAAQEADHRVRVALTVANSPVRPKRTLTYVAR